MTDVESRLCITDSTSFVSIKIFPGLTSVEDCDQPARFKHLYEHVITCMNDIARVMNVIQSQQNLARNLLHQRRGNLTRDKPTTHKIKVFSHDWKNQAEMRAIRTDMTKTVDQVNDVLITLMTGIGGDDALQDF